MKMLKGAWAQIVCIVVTIAALGWAGMTVFQSGIDDTPEQGQYKDSWGKVQQYINSHDMRPTQAMEMKPNMLSSVPMPAQVTPITVMPRAFFQSGPNNPITKVVAPPATDTDPNPVPDPQAQATNIDLPAYVKPGMLEVYRLTTGNYLVVVLPWERSMMTVTGFAIQRLEMTKPLNADWKPKTGQWVNLPKYMVADEVKAGAPAAPAGAPGAAPAAEPAPAPAAPRGLLGGAAGPAPVVGGGGLLGGGQPKAAGGFDLAPYKGIYVLFDKVEQKDDLRFDYRLVIVAKPNAEAVNKRDVDATGKPINIQVVQPKGLSVPYVSPSGAQLQVFAAGPVVQPTTTGKVQVKFVSGREDGTLASFIVMRGQAQSKIVEIEPGQEVFAELPVLDEKGRPVIGEGGNQKDDVHTGLTFSTTTVDAESKKMSVVLIGADKKEVIIEQGKTNGDPKSPEIDLALLYKIQTARDKEYLETFKAKPTEGDTKYPVPAQDFDTAAAALEGGIASLVPNDVYPPMADDTVPADTLPQLTIAPKEVKRWVPPPPRVVQPTRPAHTPRPPVVAHPLPPPDAPPGGRPGPGGFGDNRERGTPAYEEPGGGGGGPPPADAVLTR